MDKLLRPLQNMRRNNLSIPKFQPGFDISSYFSWHWWYNTVNSLTELTASLTHLRIYLNESDKKYL